MVFPVVMYECESCKGLDESDTQWDMLLAIKIDHERESTPGLLNLSLSLT